MTTKIWLLTTNCSGKTTLCSKSQTYKDILLFDHDIVNHLIPHPQSCLTFLRQQLQPSCLMTSFPSYDIGLQSYENYKSIDDISIAAVILPLEQLLQNLKQRIIEHPAYINENTLSLSIYHHELYVHALKCNLPIYQSFTEAIDNILKDT